MNHKIKNILFVFTLANLAFLNVSLARSLKVHNYNASQNTHYITSESAFLTDEPTGPQKDKSTVGRVYLYSDLTSLYNPWIDLDENSEIYQGTLIKRASMLDLGVGYLWTEKIQVGLNLPIEQLETESNPVNTQLDGTKTTGLGDSKLSLKWNFLNWGSHFGFTLMPEIFLPTGFSATNHYYATAVSTEKTGIGASWSGFGAGLKFLAEYKYNWFQTVLNIGLEHHENANITGKSSVYAAGEEYSKVDHSDQIPVSLAFLFQVHPKWGLNIEGSTFLDKKHNEYTQPNEGYAGIRYQWSDWTSLHFGYGGGLGEFTAKDRWTLGIKTPLYRPSNPQTMSEPEAPKPSPVIQTENVKIENKKIDIKKVIQFKTGSSELTEESQLILDEIVSVLNNKNFTYSILNIEGHTDHLGNDDKNMILSEKRAETVYKYFISKNIPAEKLTYKGYGETRPLITKKHMTKEELLKNRRVDFVFKD